MFRHPARPGVGSDTVFAGLIGLLLVFAVLAKGAHDIWAATVVYSAVLGLFLACLIRNGWPHEGPGFSIRPLPFVGLIAFAMTLSFFSSTNPSEAFLGWMDWVAAMTIFAVGGAFWWVRRT